MKYWLLLFVISVILPSNLYWMVTIAGVIQTFHRFVRVCVRVPATMLYCVATRAVASCYFIYHVHVPQPSFGHSQLYFLFSSIHTLSRHAHGLGVLFV